MTNLNEVEGITITRENDKVNIVLDMSMFDVFELCKAKYNYRHNMLKGTAKKAKALDLGGVMHEGMEVYFNELKKGEHFNDRLDKAVKKIQEVSSDPDQSDLDPDEVNILISAIEQSCDYWRFEDEQMEILEVERSFAYVLYEDDYVRIIITGKIDLLVNIPQIGRNSGYQNLPIDHKTFSRDFEVLELSNQFENYCSAVGSHYLFVNRIGLQKTLKPEDKFKRVPLSYDPFMLEDWRRNVTHGILREYLDCIATGYWKMNFTSCLKFNRKCEYYDVCKRGTLEGKMQALESNFTTVSPWDVTAKLSKGE